MQQSHFQGFDPSRFDSTRVKTGSKQSQKQGQKIEELIFDYETGQYMPTSINQKFAFKYEPTTTQLPQRKKVNFWKFFIWKFLPCSTMAWGVVVFCWSIPQAAIIAAPIVAKTGNWLLKLGGAIAIITIGVYCIVNMLDNFINSAGSFEKPSPPERSIDHYPTRSEEGATIINNIQNNYYS